MSSMSGSYLAGVEGEPGADDGGDVEAEEENQDAFMESRGPSQQDGVRHPVIRAGGCREFLPVIGLLALFLPGVLPGAKGQQLFPGCRGAGFRGDERPHVNEAVFIRGFRATFVLSAGQRRD